MNDLLVIALFVVLAHGLTLMGMELRWMLTDRYRWITLLWAPLLGTTSLPRSAVWGAIFSERMGRWPK